MVMGSDGVDFNQPISGSNVVEMFWINCHEINMKRWQTNARMWLGESMIWSAVRTPALG